LIRMQFTADGVVGARWTVLSHPSRKNKNAAREGHPLEKDGMIATLRA
jgi:hypothetical protein